MTTKEQTCAEQVARRCTSRLAEISDLINLYNIDDAAYHPDHETRWDEYGLCLDYVAPETFDGQDFGYLRFQISYGGPSEEVRFYYDAGLQPYRIEFWYLDWFDGACEDITNHDTAALMAEQFDCSVQHLMGAAGC